MFPHEYLIAAKQLIINPENWLQKMYAGILKDSGRVQQVPLDYEEANCFCSVGAIERISQESGKGKAFAMALGILGEVSRDMGFSDIVSMNDTVSHEIVMSAFDKAITIAKDGAP